MLLLYYVENSFSKQYSNSNAVDYTCGATGDTAKTSRVAYVNINGENLHTDYWIRMLYDVGNGKKITYVARY